VCVRNEALSRRRSAARQVALERRIATEPVERDDVAERLSIRNALAILPREQRDVIELAYWGEYTQTEIAAKLAVPLGTIKSRASLGLRKLARALGAQE
jgi:RNA polymerase sigma factor (sigma-70 family)